jgi:hypothetical protein
MFSWRIVFSTFRECMSFYTARVKSGKAHNEQMLSAFHPKADMRPVILRLNIKYAPRLFPSQCNYLVAGGANKEPIALHEEHARLPLRHSANAVPRSRSLPALKV